MGDIPEFQSFPKIPRLYRDCVITEKIDGTNAQILITEDNDIFAGSRSRWLSVKEDNFGFARWVEGYKNNLLNLGPGRHFGEWWGSGIQRGYGLNEKRLSLFNSGRWNDEVLDSLQLGGIVSVVPVLYEGLFGDEATDLALTDLEIGGSQAAPDFMDPEGVVVYHTASRSTFKVLLKNDASPKGD